MKQLSRISAIVILGILLEVSQVRGESTRPDRSGFLRDFYAAYNAKDGTKMAEFYTPDATFVDPTFELDLKGPEQIGNLLNRVLAKYETLDHEIIRTISAGDDLVVEGMMVGKVSGKTVKARYVSIFHFQGDKIASQRDMFDTLHYLVQIGVVTSPFGPKPGAATPAGSPAKGS